jgi:hypothetical protein
MLTRSGEAFRDFDRVPRLSSLSRVFNGRCWRVCETRHRLRRGLDICGENARLSRSVSAVAPGVPGLPLRGAPRPPAPFQYNHGMGFRRMLGLLFGVPILLIGLMWIAIDMGLSAESTSPFHVPFLAICGAGCLYLGYRLIFTKPLKPADAKSQE